MSDFLDIQGNVVTNVILGLDGIVYNLNANDNILYSLDSESCGRLNYEFEPLNNVCKWPVPQNDTVFDVLINSDDDDGGLFLQPEDSSCTLNVSFDYVFRFECTQSKGYAGEITFETISQLKIDYILQAIDENGNKVIIDEVPLLDLLNNDLINTPTGLFFEAGSRSCNNEVSRLIEEFNDNNVPVIPNTFYSTWVKFNKNYTDQNFINNIINKKLRIGLKVENLPFEIILTLDNIKINSVCLVNTITETKILNNPSFLIEKVIDNKKSWLDSDTYREHDLSYRETKYSVENDLLVLNSKEIDLHFSSDNGIEYDLWVFIKNNINILNGEVDGVNISDLIGEDISSIGNLFEFMFILNTRLIDAKSRKTLSGYPTLKLVYYRYVNSFLYCGVQSNAFTYNDMINFIDILDNHWIDLVEQFIPSTTIWGSTNKISNSMFDSEKFVYKKYSLTPTRYFGTRDENPSISFVTPGNNIGVQIVDLKTGIEEIFEGYLAIKQTNDGSEFYSPIFDKNKTKSVELDGTMFLTEENYLTKNN